MEVWDYSRRNIERPAATGVTARIRHVPVGCVPELTRITLVNDAGRRSRLAARGLERMAARDEAGILRAVLGRAGAPAE